MRILRVVFAFVLSVVASYFVATLFYTQQVIAKQAAFGAGYTTAQKFQTFAANLQGFWAYGAMLAIALLLGFIIAALVKQVARPLAPVAYPIGGAAAVLLMLYLIETVVIPGGVGVIGGARDAFGVSLQGVAGLVGGAVFAMMRGART